MTEMLYKRGSCASTYHGGYIYAVGGVNYTDKVMKKCERLNLERNEWQVMPNMNEPRKNASLCPMTTDTIYVFGG